MSTRQIKQFSVFFSVIFTEDDIIQKSSIFWHCLHIFILDVFIIMLTHHILYNSLQYQFHHYVKSNYYASCCHYFDIPLYMSYSLLYHSYVPPFMILFHAHLYCAVVYFLLVCLCVCVSVCLFTR